MSVPNNYPEKDSVFEVVNMDLCESKRFHSETDLNEIGKDISDNIEVNNNITREFRPVLKNTPVNRIINAERKRTRSQPTGVPVKTAMAMRANRRRPARSVMYADIQRSESDRQTPKIVILPEDEDSPTAVVNMAQRERSNTLPNYNGTKGGDGRSPTNNDREITFSPTLGNGNLKNADVKSLNNYRIYTTVNDYRGGTTPRKRSVATMDAMSMRSIDAQYPAPTSPELNKQLTIKYNTIILSSMYAIMLVTLGIIFNVVDPFTEVPVANTYMLILGFMGLFYKIYILVDIGRYKKIASNNQKLKEMYEEKVNEFLQQQEELEGTGNPPMYSTLNIPPPKLEPETHDYCFNEGRHSGSFYLKLGATAFALGHLIHSILQIFTELSYLMDTEVENNVCTDIPNIILHLFLPLYCFVKLYFIFKYSNVIVMKAQGLARFAFMHMIGSSLCFWIGAILRETMLALVSYSMSKEDETDYYSGKSTNRSLLEATWMKRDERCFNDAAKAIAEKFSPYLFPFSIEFNILIVAVYYIIWTNIGSCHQEELNVAESSSTSDDNVTLCKHPSANEENDFTSNIVIYADCHASNKGLFFGLILTVLVIGMTIMSFIFSSLGGDYLETGYVLTDCTKLAIHLVLLATVILAFNQTTKLDINEHPISLLDDVLLFICIPAFFMETVLTLFATLTIVNYIKSAYVIVMMIQVIIQTPLLVDGLRRCSNSKKLRRTKPGREVIIFLLIANVAMWLLYTFSYKSPKTLDERYEFYGKELWTILSHISMPLIMFYRFHSSVCFADIWDSAYQPGSDH